MMTISEAVSAKPSLYDRSGGVYNIATVVEYLIDRIMVDARLNANPRVDEAHHKVPRFGSILLKKPLFPNERNFPEALMNSSENHVGGHLISPVFNR
ncbi:MAG: hypothetical protein WBD83_14190 [Xanthobacteraceae bacterium]